MSDELLLVKTAEELEAFGSLDEIKTQLKPCLPPSAQLAAESYPELLKDIEWIAASVIREGQVFVDRRQEHIYYLLDHANGKERKQKLGVQDDFYEKKGARAASKWRNRISFILRQDIYSDERTRQAFQRLQEMYAEMTQLQFDDPLVALPGVPSGFGGAKDDN